MRLQRRCRDMKGALTSILMSVAILLAISSCATVSKEPLAPGQLRLLRASIPGSGLVYLGTVYDVDITFEADGKPTIRRACFYFSWSGEGPFCYAVRPRDVEFGPPGSLRVTLPPAGKSGPSRVDCFVEDWQDSKILRTNVIHFSIDAF
jgi:hypothetical protein